jgi:hypothetical protein
VQASFAAFLATDNILSTVKTWDAPETLPIVKQSSPAVSDDLADLNLGAVLIETDGPATLERVRTLLTAYAARSAATGAPQTFGEVAQVRAVLLAEIEQITLVMVALTLLVAGCSLTMAVAGGLVERRRPFTLLRLAGTPTPTLYKVVLLESALPLVVAAVVAAGAGIAVAVPVFGQLAIKGASVALPGHVYFLSMSGGLAASLAVILAALPLLKRVTEPDNARFE